MLVLGSLVAAELAACGLLAWVPSLGDPWSPVATLESDLAVVAQRQRLYVRDRELFWRLAPNVDLLVENGVLETRDEPVRWRLRTNALGFRGHLPGSGGPRVLAVGDSSTFGFRVNDDEAYATRLATACGARGVLNAGIPGYTSYQGRRLLPALLTRFRPDVVTIAFGANDRESATLADAERAMWLDTAVGRLTYLSAGSALYRLADGVLRRLAGRPSGALRPRVEPGAYRENVDAMIALARGAGARVVLLDLVFLGPFYRDTLRELAVRWDVPYIDGRALLDAAFERIAAGEAYTEEARRWLDFYRAHVLRVRPVYFEPEFYRSRLATDRQQRQFMTLMADLIHPNALGHRVLADALTPIVCGDR